MVGTNEIKSITPPQRGKMKVHGAHVIEPNAWASTEPQSLPAIMVDVVEPMGACRASSEYRDAQTSVCGRKQHIRSPSRIPI